MTTDTDMWAASDAELEHAAPSRPADIDAERSIAASVMVRPDLIDELSAEGFDPVDFSEDRYRWIWYAVEELRTSFRDGEIRWLAVDRQLQAWRADGCMPTVPLTDLELSALYQEAAPASATWCAQRVADKGVAARGVTFAHDARLRFLSPAFDAETDVASLQSSLDGITRPTATAQSTAIADLMGPALEKAHTKPSIEDRIPTGFIDLDGVTSGGFAPGQLIVIGARPAMGKTTLATGLARAAAVQTKIPTLFLSLEMSEQDIANGILCAESRVALHHHKGGIVDDAGLARMADSAARIAQAPLRINDRSELTLPGLRAQVRQLVRTIGLRYVIVDYLQLMQAPKAENRQVEVSKLSRGLKLLAREFGITVVILAQLNRGPEQRTEKRPLPSDLRESGAIEQDADLVLLLHREDAYDKESPRAGEADLIVGKHRGGPTGIVTVAFQGHYARFVDMAQT